MTVSITYCVYLGCLLFYLFVYQNTYTETRHKKKKPLDMQNQRRISAAQLISAFVFATLLVQSLFFIYPKFEASSHILWLYRLVGVETPKTGFHASRLKYVRSLAPYFGFNQ